MVGVLDVVHSFKKAALEALQSPCAWILALVQALLGVLIYWLVTRFVWKTDLPFYVTALLFGLSSNVLIRTKFLVARNLGTTNGPDGLGLDIGWVLDRITQLLRGPIDNKVYSIQQPAINELAAKAPSVEWLREELLRRVRRSNILRTEEKDEIESQVSRLLEQAGIAEFEKREALAAKICDVGGVKYVRKLVGGLV